MTLGVLHDSLLFTRTYRVLARLGPERHTGMGDCLGVWSGPSAPPCWRQCSRAAAQRVNLVGCWEGIAPSILSSLCLLPSPFPASLSRPSTFNPALSGGKSKPGRQGLSQKLMENLLAVAATRRHVIYRARKLCRIGLALVRPDHSAGSLPAKSGMSLFWDPFYDP